MPRVTAIDREARGRAMLAVEEDPDRLARWLDRTLTADDAGEVFAAD